MDNYKYDLLVMVGTKKIKTARYSFRYLPAGGVLVENNAKGGKAEIVLEDFEGVEQLYSHVVSELKLN